MPGRRCVAIAGVSGAGKSDLARRIEGAFVLEMDDYFRDYGTPDYYLRPEWDTPQAYDLSLLEAQARALLKGEEVTLPRFDFLSGRRIPGKKVSLAVGRVLVVEGLYAFLLSLPFEKKIFLEATFAQMVERCLPRDQEKRGRRDLKKILGMYETSWKNYEKFLFPQRQQADLVLPHEWAEKFPAKVKLEDLG